MRGRGAVLCALALVAAAAVVTAVVISARHPAVKRPEKDEDGNAHRPRPKKRRKHR